MSVRIETIEQLQDSSLVEKVLDRLRRTTKPRQFAFKKRCKLLDGKPVLITAPPGRKVKSSLLRKLRLGTPTLKGVVHREQQALIFTFKQDVNKSDTARWIAKCMHDAKSPVPLKYIIILGPKDTKMKATEGNKASDSSNPGVLVLIEDNDVSTSNSIPDETDVERHTEEVDEEILSPETLLEPSSLDELLHQHISSKKMLWLKETEQRIERLERIIQDQGNILEQLELSLHQQEESIRDLDIQLDSHTSIETSAPLPNPWIALLKDCQNSSMTLDAFRELLDASSLSTTVLLKELQFTSEDQEIQAFNSIRTYCLDMAKDWSTKQKPTVATLKQQHSTSLSLQRQLEIDLNNVQTQLDSSETKQSALMIKLSKRRVEIYQQLHDILTETPSAQTSKWIVLIKQRQQLCQNLIADPVT